MILIIYYDVKKKKIQIKNQNFYFLPLHLEWTISSLDEKKFIRYSKEYSLYCYSHICDGLFCVIWFANACSIISLQLGGFITQVKTLFDNIYVWWVNTKIKPMNTHYSIKGHKTLFE